MGQGRLNAGENMRGSPGGNCSADPRRTRLPGTCLWLPGDNPGVKPVAVVGNLALDRVDGGLPRPGGGPFHAARALRALNRPALLVARGATADRPALLPPLARLGVPVVWRDAPAT